MKFKTLNAKERHFNELYFDCFSEEHAVDNFIYLCSKERGKGNRTTESHLRKCYYNRELGSLLRRLDPIAFNTI